MQCAASTSEWKRFFVGAGIPQSVAATYAVTFADHRIRMDMLKDLTKDILFDMGIKAMGDVIAILRHAKHVHTQVELKGESKPAPPNQSAVSANNATSYNSTTGQFNSNNSMKPSNSPHKQQNNNNNSNTDNNSNLSFGNNTISLGAKRSLSISSTLSSSIAKRLRPALETSSPPARTAASVVQEEKTLTVKHPAGTTERTKRLLSQMNSHLKTTSNRAPISSRLSRPTSDRNDTTHSSSSSNSSRPLSSRIGTPASVAASSTQPARLKSTVFSRLGNSSVSASSRR